MLQGITVLSSSNIDPTISGQSIIIFMFVFAIVICVISLSRLLNNKKEPLMDILIAVSIFMMILAAVASVSINSLKPYTIYNVTLSPEVKLLEFNKHYDVLKVDGQIYTIREREIE